VIRENVLRDLMLYPRQLVVPMVDGADLHKLQNPDVIGLLFVTVVSAKNLRIADVTSSDPYVSLMIIIIIIMSRSFVTSMIIIIIVITIIIGWRELQNPDVRPTLRNGRVGLLRMSLRPYVSITISSSSSSSSSSSPPPPSSPSSSSSSPSRVSFQVKIRYTAEHKFETPVRANTLNPTWDLIIIIIIIIITTTTIIIMVIIVILLS
jgi:hypothetical protein